MEIKAQIIKGINYKPILECGLTEIAFDELDINSAKSSALILFGQNRLAVSKWISPKRTRSYPYERVYNTFSVSKRLTMIPVVKDEGASGDRDFLQWDTISLMSLLDVYVIAAYYKTAEKHRSQPRKITKQKFDNDFVREKIEEIATYHSSALHWNLKELNNIPQVLEKTRISYRNIAQKTGISFHNESGIATNIPKDLVAFKEISREKSRQAQNREFLTTQTKERILGNTKAKITISDYLEGKYFWTVDETLMVGKKIQITECKHAQTSKLPKVGDIKDGLLKMMLYANLENAEIGGNFLRTAPILKLTSAKLSGAITSNSDEIELENFYRINNLTKRQKTFL